MDKTLTNKLTEFKQALGTFQEALAVEADKDVFVRDAAIKRFEYCFELCWKTAKVFLLEKKGESVFSPKDCFRSLGKIQLLSAEEIELLLQMVDDRNESAHTYDEEFVQGLYGKLKDYYSVMEKVFGLMN